MAKMYIQMSRRANMLAMSAEMFKCESASECVCTRETFMSVDNEISAFTSYAKYSIRHK